MIIITSSFCFVKLFYKWTIKGAADNQWCIPNPSSGEPGVLYNVGILPSDNTGLDDRVDTLSLTSEGWTAKKIIIFQKGTAYLRTVVGKNTLSENVGDKLVVGIESNQNWKVLIDNSVDWMAFDGNSTGNGNGSITLISTKNNSSLRQNTKIYIYDRHDVKRDSVVIYQNGIYLDILNKRIDIPMKGGNGAVKIESNTDWLILISEHAKSWLSVDRTSGSNDQILNFTIDKNSGLSRSTYVKVMSNPYLVLDSILFTQSGVIPFTEKFFEGDDITFNSDGSATLFADPGSESRVLRSKATNFSYGKYIVNFADVKIARESSTMLMSITSSNKFNGGISWGVYASPKYTDGWASEYWLSDGFGSKVRQRFDNDILRADIKSFVIDVKRSKTSGMVDIDFYINDILLKSEKATDGFLSGNPMIISFWIYNYYDKTNSAVFRPITLSYEAY